MNQMLKPSVAVLLWLGALALVALLLGIGSALGIQVPDMVSTAFFGALGALLIVALVDAYRVLRTSSPGIGRRAPGSFALGRWAEIRLLITPVGQTPLTLQLFDHVPNGLDYEHLPQTLILHPGQEIETGYRVRPLQRGFFTFEQCEVELSSPMRFWTVRRYLETPGSVRVFPDFARAYSGQLLAVDNWLSQLGVRQRQRRGLGMEFNQLREFREGDSLRQIDWKATARHRTPIAREYQDERDQQIVFMLDCGRRMRSKDGDLSHFDHSLNALLLLAHVALRQGDAVGLSTFAGEQNRYLPPAKGHTQLNVLLNSVYDLDTTRKAADYSAAVRQLLARQKRRAMVILLTNLRDENDQELLSAVKLLGRKHRPLVVSLREEVLDTVSETPVRTYADALNYCGAVDYLGARADMHQRLHDQGIPVLNARPAELGAQLISRYQDWKRSGLL
jgi:uncharacterized protein (DUF58 family)